MNLARRATALAPLVLATLALIIVLGAGQDDQYTVRAEFEDSGGLRENSDVKIDGVPVGHVSALEVTADDTALATLSVDRAAGALGKGATANVRAANLLGEKYVDLELGQPTRQDPPSTIPTARTGAPVELDDLLNVLDERTRSLLAVLINESGIALSGRGSDFNEMLGQLPTALDQSQKLIADLGADNRALGQLVESSDRFLESIADERRAIARWVASVEGALTTTASRSDELGETIRQAPSTVSQLRGSLSKLRSTGLAMAPSASALRAAAPNLTSLLRQLPPFTDAATPTLRTTGKVAPALERLGRDATPVVRRLRPAVSDLDDLARTLDPASDSLNKSFDDTLGVLEGWARLIQARDGAGHMFRGEFIMGEDTIRTLISRYVRPPSAQARDSRTQPKDERGPAPKRDERQPGQRKPESPSSLLDSALSPLDKVGGKIGRDRGSPLSGEVEELLDFLVGRP